MILTQSHGTNFNVVQLFLGIIFLAIPLFESYDLKIIHCAPDQNQIKFSWNFTNFNNF